MFDQEYFTSLRFLNETQSISFFVVYYAIFTYMGGAFIAFVSTLGALVASVLLQGLLFNRRQPVPKNSAILITGCSTGIGFDAATKMSAEGFVVYATVRKDADKKNLSDFASENKTTIVPVIMDVTNDESIADAVKVVRADLQQRKLNLLSVINNAGYSEVGAVEATPSSSLRKQFDTNVFGAVSVSNAFLPLLRESGKAMSNSSLKPSLLLVSSVVGKVSLAGMSLYCSSKFALEALADGYRQELKMFDINVVCIEPGSIRTQFLDTCVKTATVNTTAEPAQSTEDTESNILALYARETQEQMKDSAAAVEKMAQPASLVTEAFLQAVLSPRPLTRIRAGRDANVFVPLVRWLPDAMVDMASGRYFKKRA